MSTSFRSFFTPQPAAPVEDFHYPETSESKGGAPAIEPGGDETTKLLMRAHAEGVREGEERERIRYAEKLAQEQGKINEVIRRFQTELSDYYSWVELEVVQLSLAIASKVLHYEAQVDPALLAKLVKPVLEKLHGNTKVKVRVRPEEAAGCREYFSQDAEIKSVIEVIADESVAPQNCILETQLGSTEVGLTAQLQEIEAGLFDLLAQRPPAQ